MFKNHVGWMSYPCHIHFLIISRSAYKVNWSNRDYTIRSVILITVIWITKCHFTLWAMKGILYFYNFFFFFYIFDHLKKNSKIFILIRNCFSIDCKLVSYCLILALLNLQNYQYFWKHCIGKFWRKLLFF